MTREEAKEILTHNWTRVDNPNYSESELDEAFFMAIEALKEKNRSDSLVRDDAENCKESESKLDLISRADAIGVLMKTMAPPSVTLDTLVIRIDSLPSAEAVEAVRCKDCIRTKERDEYTGLLWCSIHRGYMEDTYYCADGLRREDGEA